MTVKELRDKLSGYEDTDEVYFLHPSHDHWGATLASEVDEVSDMEIEYSDYHRQWREPHENRKMRDSYKDPDDDEEEGREPIDPKKAPKVVVTLS